MAMKERYAQIAFKRADLSAHSRLADLQHITRMRETSRIGRNIEDTDFVPIDCR
jgi:hypothetical protein